VVHPEIAAVSVAEPPDLPQFRFPEYIVCTRRLDGLAAVFPAELGLPDYRSQEIVDGMFRHAADADRDLVLAGNAARVWNL
jgi:hypothetical protein